MENKLIIGNIKMNMKFGELANYIEHFKNINNKNVVVCPSYIYIPYFLNYNFSVGSQNVCAYEDGGYTGEVSARQLASIGVEYAIVGHSERRIKLNESNTEINKKVKNCLESKLKVILCIGETLEESKLLKKDQVLKRQIRDALFDIKDLSNVIIAYEPVWSIGTNKIPNNDELINTIKYIKELVKDLYKNDIKVIYGGSINERNIDKLKEIKKLDGFLIGSASINPLKFIEIIEKIA
ncbi:MAG: triose-phosphate isomerase [Firmicutes bacterium]|nr:triose-phosphate isomerase [Bacillota bacterium]